MDGSWDGLVGYLLRGEADVAVASLTINQVIHYLPYFFELLLAGILKILNLITFSTTNFFGEAIKKYSIKQMFLGQRKSCRFLQTLHDNRNFNHVKSFTLKICNQ